MKGDLVKLANRLDSLGLTKEADYLDAILRKMGGEGDDLESEEGLSSEDSSSYDQMYREKTQARIDLHVNRPDSVSEQPEYYAQKLVSIESEAAKSGNILILEWIEDLIEDMEYALVCMCVRQLY